MCFLQNHKAYEESVESERTPAVSGWQRSVLTCTHSSDQRFVSCWKPNMQNLSCSFRRLTLSVRCFILHNRCHSLSTRFFKSTFVPTPIYDPKALSLEIFLRSFGLEMNAAQFNSDCVRHNKGTFQFLPFVKWIVITIKSNGCESAV